MPAVLEKHPVLRFIRCKQTGRYLSENGWTSDTAEAIPFEDTLEAVRVCISEGLRDVELVLRSPECTTELFSTTIR